MNRHMTWREICPILLRAMADGKAHERSDLKRIPERTPGFDHDFGRYGKDSMTSYRSGWSLTLMNNAGLVENVGHGLWRVSDKAKQMAENQILSLLEETSQEMQNNATKKRKKTKKDTIKSQDAAKQSALSSDYMRPSLESIRSIQSLITLSKQGLITLEAAMQGIEKAAFALSKS